MIQVNMHEAKTHLSRLIERVIDGEEVIIARGNEPIAKIVLLDEFRSERRVGSAQGEIEMLDTFEEPLEDFQDYMA